MIVAVIRLTDTTITMPDVTITLAENEALVLFGFLARYSDIDVLGTEDQAEQQALWNLHCLLERHLVQIFDPNFRDLLITARNSLRSDGSTNAGLEQGAGRLAFWLHPDAITFIADEWRKLPRDMPKDDREQWADIAFRAMSALHKAGIDYRANPPENGYHLGDAHNDTGGSIDLSS